VNLLAILKNHKIVSYKVAKGSKSANLEFLIFLAVVVVVVVAVVVAV
jgi:hypothetical protein